MKSFNIKTTLFLSAMVGLCAPVFTACSDDDEPQVKVIENYELSINSLNITWDEREGVVELAAPANWKATSHSPWIEIDPSKGAMGETRVFLNFTPNPYRLPRVGTLEIVCNDKVETVTVTQAGCSDPSQVAPSKADIEIASFDYETGEIDLAAFADAIKGNLGLTMAEFGQGVEEGGNVEFFMLGSNGEWIEGGTSGTKCGAWLDGDMNVTNWDPSGYPAIATFVEVYGDDEAATLVIGRAPGVPDNAEFNLKFVFTLANDHTKYTVFNVTVVYPAADMNGNIVATIPLTANIQANEGYEATPVAFDANEVCSLLGAPSIEMCKVVSYDAEGEFIGYTANNGYWFMEDGSVGGWGDGAGWFIEYWGEDEEDPASASSWMVGPFPTCHQASAVSKIGFWYNGSSVMFDIQVNISE